MIGLDIAGFFFKLSWDSGIDGEKRVGPQLNAFRTSRLAASDAKSHGGEDKNKLPCIGIHVENLATAEIRAKERLPIICEGRLGAQTLWDLRKDEQHYVISTYRHFSDSDAHHITLANEDFSQFTVYPLQHPESQPTDVPLLSFPLLSLILYYQTTVHDAIYLHGSAVIDNGIARVFTGKSGVGKTTIAHTWQNAGYKLINDDRLMLRLTDTGVMVFNTPMIYTANPVSAPIDSIYLLKQASELELHPVHGVHSVSRVLANCIIQGFSSHVIEHHLSVISRICLEARTFEFQNKPGPETVSFVKTYEQEYSPG